MSEHPDDRHKGYRDERFQAMVKIAREWADEHRAMGHAVWTHFRSFIDFHLECFTCNKIVSASERVLPAPDQMAIK